MDANTNTYSLSLSLSHTHTHTHTHARTHTQTQTHICVYTYIDIHMTVGEVLYQIVIRKRFDCGKTPILIGVYLTGIPQHWSTAMALFKKCHGNETVRRSGPPPRKQNFLKNTLCRNTFQKPARGVLWESLVLLEGDLTCEPFRSYSMFWRGPLRWGNAVGFLLCKHWLE